MSSTCPRSGERPRPTRDHYPYNEINKRHNFKIRRSNGSVCLHDQLLLYKSDVLRSVRPAVGQPQSDFAGSLIELVTGMRFTSNGATETCQEARFHYSMALHFYFL